MGFKVGSSATKDLLDFISCFEALSEQGPEGDALRDKAFKSADPNGNGLCSLAELETFVLKELIKKYPKTKKGQPNHPMDRGSDLFIAFRPCYIRAFTDAKDFSADFGDVIEGTKKSTADDFVSKPEFRLFNAYLCIYATMFDAFAKIDGGGAGRTKTDDRKIDLSEWLAGYHDCEDYGFVALRFINRGDDSAVKLFERIDDNSSGTIMLDEWCDFLKAAEIKAGTALGATLAEDEEGGIGKQWVAPSGAAPVPLRVKAPKGFKASTDDIKARKAAVTQKEKETAARIEAAAEAKAAAAKRALMHGNIAAPAADPSSNKVREDALKRNAEWKRKEAAAAAEAQRDVMSPLSEEGAVSSLLVYDLSIHEKDAIKGVDKYVDKSRALLERVEAGKRRRREEEAAKAAAKAKQAAAEAEADAEVERAVAWAAATAAPSPPKQAKSPPAAAATSKGGPAKSPIQKRKLFSRWGLRGGNAGSSV
jgi:Ca2+-binding EF-hand superfamily protein